MNPLERLYRKTREVVIQKLPISWLPPYGTFRKRFQDFLQNIPEGGLGFHATTSLFKPSIEKDGLDPSLCYSYQGSEPEVNYLVLNPATNPITRLYPGVEGKIATYYLLRHTISSLTESYGGSYHREWIEENGLEDQHQPMLVILRGVEELKKNEIGGPLSDDYHLRGIRDKSFILGRRYDFGRGQIEELPWYITDKVGQAYIVDTPVVIKNESIRAFTDRVILELMERFHS